MKSVKRANEEDANLDSVEVTCLQKQISALEVRTRKDYIKIEEEKKTLALRVARNEIIEKKISQHALLLDGRSIQQMAESGIDKHIRATHVLDLVSKVDTARFEMVQ